MKIAFMKKKKNLIKEKKGYGSLRKNFLKNNQSQKLNQKTFSEKKRERKSEIRRLRKRKTYFL